MSHCVFLPSTLFTPGRACLGPLAVVLHEYQSGIEVLDAEMRRCFRPRLLVSPACHTSFHYGIGNNCSCHQYVKQEDTAWGFYYIPTPVCPIPPCPIEQTCDGVGSDQYNPDFDGNPATPPFGAGPDNTANCAVIHVAVTTGSGTGISGIFCINDPQFSPQAYNCLVRDLCDIFKEAGLTPVSGTTLLTHIDELVNLDLDQLAIDIQECLDFVPPPPPPCECTPIETPLTVIDTPSIDLTVSGVNLHTLQADVNISSVVGNITTILPDGVYTPDTSLVFNKCSGSLTNLDTVITVQDFGVSEPDTTQTLNIWASDSLGVCPSRLVSIPCDPQMTTGTVVLGSSNGIDPVWMQVQRQYLRVLRFTSSTSNLDITLPDSPDVFLYNDVIPHIVLLNAPNPANCGKNDLWIKNISPNSVLTIDGNGTTIDGQSQINLDPQVVAGYPFGNNGGEAVHLVYQLASNEWFVL